MYMSLEWRMLEYVQTTPGGFPTMCTSANSLSTTRRAFTLVLLTQSSPNAALSPGLQENIGTTDRDVRSIDSNNNNNNEPRTNSSSSPNADGVSDVTNDGDHNGHRYNASMPLYQQLHQRWQQQGRQQGLSAEDLFVSTGLVKYLCPIQDPTSAFLRFASLSIKRVFLTPLADANMNAPRPTAQASPASANARGRIHLQQQGRRPQQLSFRNVYSLCEWRVDPKVNTLTGQLRSRFETTGAQKMVAMCSVPSPTGDIAIALEDGIRLDQAKVGISNKGSSINGMCYWQTCDGERGVVYVTDRNELFQWISGKQPEKIAMQIDHPVTGIFSFFPLGRYCLAMFSVVSNEVLVYAERMDRGGERSPQHYTYKCQFGDEEKCVAACGVDYWPYCLFISTGERVYTCTEGKDHKELPMPKQEPCAYVTHLQVPFASWRLFGGCTDGTILLWQRL
jgi:hypothetical protein